MISFIFIVFLIMQHTAYGSYNHHHQYPRGSPDRRGRPGPQGYPGYPGPPGPAGKDPAGKDSISSNWKQCAWRKSDGKDVGLIKTCVFNKKYSETSLRVLYGGNLRINNCDNCCARWYFKINGNECKNPMAIDGVFLMWKGSGTQNIHRHRNIEGYCNGIPKGMVNVGFWVGKCVGYGYADAASGWNSVSRIVIEEVPPPQA